MIGPLMIGLGLIPAWVAGLALARRMLATSDRLTQLLAAATLCWAWLSLGTLGLGLAGWLDRVPLLAWSSAGLLILLLPRPERGPDRPDDRGWKLPPEAIVALGLTLWAGLALLGPSLLFPVKVVSDGPIYHLYFAARWWKEGRIFPIPTPFGESAAPYFPANGDLWHTWLFVAWGGERLAKVGQVPFLVLGSATVFALARRSGSARGASLIASCWFATVAPLMIFSFEPNVDTLFVAGYLLSVYFAVVARDVGSAPGLFVVSGLAAGLAWGTKAPGIVFIPPLLIGIVASVLTTPMSGRAKRFRVGVLLLSALAPEVYWLVRNGLLTGNPLYPLDLTISGRTLLRGWYGPAAMPTSPYYIRSGDWRSLVDLLLLVLDPRQVPFWLLALAGAWRLGARPTSGDRIAWTCAALAFLNLALFWLVIPYRTQQRFFLQAAGLAAAPLSRLIGRARWLRWLAVGLLATHLLTPSPWPLSWRSGRPPWDLSDLIPSTTPPILSLRRATTGRGADPISILVRLGCLASAAGLRLRDARRRWAVLGAGLALVGSVEMASIVPSKAEGAIRWKFPLFRDYLAGWLDLDLRTSRPGTRIAYAGTNLPYYLMGNDFRNEVRYVNVDAHPSWLLHDYHRDSIRLGLPSTWPDTRPGWDRLHPDYASWLVNLERDRIQLLIVARANPAEGRLNPFDAENFPIERAWADAHPDRFSLLYADPLFRTYGVRNEVKRAGVATDSVARPH